MAEYRDLIGIMALAKDLLWRMPSSYYNGIVKLLWEINNLPAADVAPVVRCKDCKHSYEDLCGRVCSYGVSVDCVVPDDFFCADGAKMHGGGE